MKATILLHLCSLHVILLVYSGIQWQIQDFPGGRQLPKVDVLTYYLTENCMKLKEFGPQGARVPEVPPLDLPLVLLLTSNCEFQINPRLI